jgi:AraC family transcriptional regulator
MLGGFRHSEAPSPHVRARVEQVRAYLEANMTRDIEMVSVARQAALSPFYLTRIFKAQYGLPPYRYLIRLRIDAARELLRDSVLTVTQICHRVGFNSLSHFITTFRLHVGVSPTQYRRMMDWQRDVGRYGPGTDAVLKLPRRRDA